MIQLLFVFLTLTSMADINWQGHRGARGLYPENTIGGMKEALKYPIDTLEMDVVISQDNKVVVSHEPWIEPDICLGRKINLYKLSYDQIAKFDCGSKINEKFPNQHKVKEGKPLLVTLLEDIESYLKEHNRYIQYSIEIKSSEAYEESGYQPDHKKFTDHVIQTVLGKLALDRFYIQSFDWRVLKYIKKKYPQVRVVVLTADSYKAKDALESLGFVPEVFSPHYSKVTLEDLRFFQSRGVKVIPWTVNDIEEMKKLSSMGVDGIITDYPNLIPLGGDFAPSCKKEENRFEGKCVKIPKNAISSPTVPGWECIAGYQQKRSKCIKVPVPENAILLPDGKTWKCIEGYKRYRLSCRRE